MVTVDQNNGPSSAVRFWSAANGEQQRLLKLGTRDGFGLHFLSARELLLSWCNIGNAGEAMGTGQSSLSLGDEFQESKGAFLPSEIHRGIGGCSAVSADRKWTAFTGGTYADEVLIREFASGKQHHLGGKLGTPQGVGWSKDGSSLALDPSKQHKNKTTFFRHALDLKELQLRQKIARSDCLSQYRANGDWSLHIELAAGRLEIKHAGVVKYHAADAWRVWRMTLAPTKDPTWVAWSDQGPNGRVTLSSLQTGKLLRRLSTSPGLVLDMVPSPDGRHLLSVNERQVAFIHRIADDPAKTDPQPLLYLFQSNEDWILWTKEGYYAASPGGERLMGWTIDNGPDTLPTFHPAERFRKQFYRPDVIRRALEKGNVAEALKAADAARGQKTRDVNIDQLLPPRVRLQVVDQSALPKVKVKITTDASAKTQPIQALRLMVDGKPLTEGQGYTEFQQAKEHYEGTWEITLPGEKQNAPYRLTLLARGPDTTALSNSVEVSFLNPKKLPTLHVLAIGINAYRNPALKLEAAAPDAVALKTAFEQSNKTNLFQKVNARSIVDEQATSQRVLKELNELRLAVKQNDLVVVFFAGHGLKNKDGFYFLTVEADPSSDSSLQKTALSGSQLREALRFRCQVLLMLDSCHAGAFGEKSKGVKGVLAAQGYKPATDDATREFTDLEVGVAVLCAAMGYEKAAEVSGQGLFTRAVIKALSGTPRLPHRKEHVYIHHLFSFVFDEVAEASGDTQHPFLILPATVESFPVAKLK